MYTRISANSPQIFVAHIPIYFANRRGYIRNSTVICVHRKGKGEGKAHPDETQKQRPQAMEDTTMTRFARELSGDLGAFWKKNAEQEIAKLQEQADNGEIGTTETGAAFWKSSGNFLPADCAEKLAYTDFTFSEEATAEARDAQNAAFLETYRRSAQTITAEDRMEMEATFGKGATVVNVLTGKRTKL